MMTGFAMGGLWMLLLTIFTAMVILAIMKYLISSNRSDMK
jgi:hypothetical protein